MDDVRGRTGSKTDIVESELADSGVELEEEGQRLANATGSTEDGDLGRLHHVPSAAAMQLRVQS